MFESRVTRYSREDRLYVVFFYVNVLICFAPTVLRKVKSGSIRYFGKPRETRIRDLFYLFVSNMGISDTLYNNER